MPRYMYRLITIASLAAILLVAGCNLPGYPGVATAAVSQPSPSAPPTNPVTPEPAGTEMAPGYPETPESVVTAFLDAYSQDNEAMLEYLSPTALDSLPEAGPAALLDFDGPLNGFVIQSASIVPEPPTALIAVVVEVSDKTSSREFQLSQFENRWVIDSISDPDK